MRSRQEIEAAAEAMWLAMHRATPARPGEINLAGEWKNIGPNMRRMWLLAAEEGLAAADRCKPKLRVVGD